MRLKAAEKMSRGPGVSKPPTRAFMDEMTITAKSVLEDKWMLQDLGDIVHRARMKFKPSKSRSLILKERKGARQKYQNWRRNNSNNHRESLDKSFRDSLNGHY